MKTLILLAVFFSSATLSQAQTTPIATPAATTTGSTQAAAGTKNVGSDRADAPQAPGMQGASTTSTARPGNSKTTQRGARKTKAIKADPPIK